MKKWILMLMSMTNLATGDPKKIIETEPAQKFQTEYDDQYFEINQDFEKVRHILLHLMKTVGKAATYCEIKEHGKTEPDPSVLINEVTPDLLIHALQLANHFQINLGDKYSERIETIIKRIEAQRASKENS